MTMMCLRFLKLNWKSIGIIYSLRATPAPNLVLINWRGQKILSRQHSGLRKVGWEEWFDLDLWTCDLKINMDHLLIEGNPCTKFGTDQVKGSTDTERTTLGLQADISTDRPTYRSICPLFQGGHKNIHVDKYKKSPCSSISVCCLWILFTHMLSALYNYTTSVNWRTTDQPNIADHTTIQLFHNKVGIYVI